MNPSLRPSPKHPSYFEPACFAHLAALSLLAALWLAASAVPAHASKADEVALSPEALAQLEQHASQADPREQCFLYTQLVHAMTAQAGRELADGDTEKATVTLKKMNRYAHLIQANLARNTRRVKDAEMLMQNSTYRLAQFLHLVSGEDRTTVQDTLKQLDQVNDQLLTQVFQH